MKPLKIGLIGTGGIAQTHMRALAKTDQIQVVACCDLVEEKAQRTAKEYGVPKVFTDYHELLEMDEIEAVSVCTWNQAHCAPRGGRAPRRQARAGREAHGRDTCRRHGDDEGRQGDRTGPDGRRPAPLRLRTADREGYCRVRSIGRHLLRGSGRLPALRHPRLAASSGRKPPASAPWPTSASTRWTRCSTSWDIPSPLPCRVSPTICWARPPSRRGFLEVGARRI